ncbi:aminotransferase class I and II [Pelobium manganitolerans]|uniref:Aminotransferase class I and II n=1 Tax=Pelobium manganitolerans TaxID=1842495 RepID=A0A419S9L8_9SPHI|nr:aminotransferase class I and II [Pelobium manganitolerans]
MMEQAPNLRHVKVMRYVTPLREGGSMPAIAEADDDFLYVLKFRGAGQGTNALIAELIGGELARKLGLKVPELVFAELDEAFGRTEADEEIQDLLKFSEGLNLALHYLSGAITFDPAVDAISSAEASAIVWLDALLMNMDRTAKNTNMLKWHKELWLIDHGASLYFHHNWASWKDQALSPFTLIKDHVLLKYAGEVREFDHKAKQLLNVEFLKSLVALIPDSWLGDAFFESKNAFRDAYFEFLVTRMNNSDKFIKTIEDARAKLV